MMQAERRHPLLDVFGVVKSALLHIQVIYLIVKKQM